MRVAVVICLATALALSHHVLGGVISEYSNTLSSYNPSTTEVVSTYTFTPVAGVGGAFTDIEITNQPFTASTDPLTASCIRVKTLQMTQEANATSGKITGTATVSFTTTTAFAVHASNNKITLTFPTGLVTAQAADKCGITAPVSSTATSAYASNAITLTVTSALAAGTVTVTCAGLTLAAKAAVTGYNQGLKIETSTSSTLVAYVSTPMVGGVTAVRSSALTLSTAVATDGTASLSFTTTTAFGVHATNNKITLTFPTGLVTAQAADKCGITAPGSSTATSAYASNAITLTVTSALAAGTVTVTCAGLTLAAKAAVTATAGGTDGLKIETSTSSTLVAYVSTPMVGGVLSVSEISSTFTAAFLTKTLTITSSASIQSESAEPSFSCKVTSFSNPAAQAAASNVGIVTKLSGSNVDEATGQLFPVIAAGGGGGGNVPAPSTTPSASQSSAEVLASCVGILMCCIAILF